MTDTDTQTATDEPLASELTPDADLPADDDEQPDDEQPDDEQPDDEPTLAAPVALSQADVEKRMGQLDKEAKRHDDRVRAIMGDDFGDLIPNPCDWTPGYLVNPQLAPIPPEVLDAFDAIVGRGGPGELHDDASKKRCDTCDGFGLLRTGSRVQNQDVLPCTSCTGQGWVANVDTGQTAAQPLVVVGGNGGPVPFSPGAVAADRWGRPFGHPHYNIDPAAVGV